MRRVLVSAVTILVLALAASAGADETSKRPQPRPGGDPGTAISPVAQEPRILSQVYIGEPAPDFELDSSLGRPIRLDHLKGYWVLLVFGDGRADIAPLREQEPQLRHLGVKPYGLCADKAHVIRAFAEREGLPFPLLADVTGEISQLYGLYDGKASVIRPGFVLIDRQGVVRMAMLGQRMGWQEMLALVEDSVTGSQADLH